MEAEFGTLECPRPSCDGRVSIWEAQSPRSDDIVIRLMLTLAKHWVYKGVIGRIDRPLEGLDHMIDFYLGVIAVLFLSSSAATVLGILFTFGIIG